MRIMRTLLVVIATTALLGGCAWIEQSSVSSGAHPVRGNAASSQPSVSQAGRFVAFTSSADNLVPDDTNGVADVFVHDHVKDVTERISVGTDGAQGNAASAHPSISDDGRFIALTTDASNFSVLPVPSEGRNHLYVRDRQLGTTTRIDDGTYRTGRENGYFSPTISGNGRFVAFNIEEVLTPSTIAPGGPFVRDLVTGTTKAMPNPPGLEGRFAIPDADLSLSDDGSRITYSKFNLSQPSSPGFYRFETAVADTVSAAVVATIYSNLFPEDLVGSSGVEATISGDGTTVALSESDRRAATTIFRFDLASPGLVPVHTGVPDPSLVPVNEGVPDPRELALSDDGTVLGFRRSSQYVVSTNGGTPLVVSAHRLGRAVSATDGALSGNGRWVAFSSADLRLGRDDTNGVDDVFLRSTRPTLFARPH